MLIGHAKDHALWSVLKDQIIAFVIRTNLVNIVCELVLVNVLVCLGSLLKPPQGELPNSGVGFLVIEKSYFPMTIKHFLMVHSSLFDLSDVVVVLAKEFVG